MSPAAAGSLSHELDAAMIELAHIGQDGDREWGHESRQEERPRDWNRTIIDRTCKKYYTMFMILPSLTLQCARAGAVDCQVCRSAWP